MTLDEHKRLLRVRLTVLYVAAFVGGWLVAATVRAPFAHLVASVAQRLASPPGLGAGVAGALALAPLGLVFAMVRAARWDRSSMWTVRAIAGFLVGASVGVVPNADQIGGVAARSPGTFYVVWAVVIGVAVMIAWLLAVRGPSSGRRVPT